MSDFEDNHSEGLLQVEKWFERRLAWVITNAKVESLNGRIHTSFGSDLDIVNQMSSIQYHEDEHAEFIHSLCDEYHAELSELGLILQKEFPKKNWVVTYHAYDLKTHSVEMVFTD